MGDPFIIDETKQTNSANRAVARTSNDTIKTKGRFATGRELHQASYTAYAGREGWAVTDPKALATEATRRWDYALERNKALLDERASSGQPPGTWRDVDLRGNIRDYRENYYETGGVKPAEDQSGSGVFRPGRREFVGDDEPREEGVGHATNGNLADDRTRFYKTFSSFGNEISNKDENQNDIRTDFNYVAGPGNERDAAMSALFPYAYARYGNRMTTDEDAASFWNGVVDEFLDYVDKTRKGGQGTPVSVIRDFTETFDLPLNAKALIGAVVEAAMTVDDYPLNSDEFRERRELLDWIGNSDEQNRITKKGKLDSHELHAAAKGGKTSNSKSSGPDPQPAPESTQPARIIVNPKVFKDKRDGLCTAYNEAFRVIMEMNGFDPQAEPTDEQRKFFSDTAYADDELMLRRTILARICTFDTSVKNPTDEQLDEALEFLEAVMEIGAPQSEEEQAVVQRIHDIIAKVRQSGRSGQVRPGRQTPEARPEEGQPTPPPVRSPETPPPGGEERPEAAGGADGV